ncbi:MAG: hypothetical protein ACLTSL_18650 [Odoribacter splanchnicus]
MNQRSTWKLLGETGIIPVLERIGVTVHLGITGWTFRPVSVSSVLTPEGGYPRKINNSTIV